MPTNTLGPGTATDSRLSSQQRLVLVVLLGAQFIFALDFSVVLVALPAIGSSLSIADADLQWIVTLFALTAAGLMLLMGRLGDYVGKRRMFLIGMTLLTVASLAGGLANTAAMLFSARLAQGLATAITVPAALSLLTTSFPEGSLRNKALGLNGALLSLGFAIGSVLGGVLTDLFSWRVTFLINVPVGVAILMLAPTVVRATASTARHKLDVPGALSVSGALFTLVLGVSLAEQEGWGSSLTLGLLAASAILFITFWTVELHAIEPLAPVRILKRPSVSLGNLGGLITFSMESSKVFLLTIYLQRVLGVSAFTTGVAFGVLGAGAFTGGLLAARVIGRISARSTLVLGLTIQGASVLCFLALGHGVRVGLTTILIGTAVGGFGHVLAIVSYTVSATSGLPDDEQGLATGLTAMTQQIAFTVGTPIISAVALGYAANHSKDNDAVLGGVHLGLLANALVILLGAAAILALLKRNITQPAPSTAQALITD